MTPTDAAAPSPRKQSSARATMFIAALVVAVLAALPAAAPAKPVEKKVAATIVYLQAVNPANPGNCGVLPVLQWQDPTENRFVGTNWEAHYFWMGQERVVTPVPPFHNRFTWLGNDFAATGGTNWWKPGDGTWRAGRPEGAAEACARYLTTYQERFGTQAWVIVTGEEDTSDSAECRAAEKALRAANRKVGAARKQVNAADTAAAKDRARERLVDAQKSRAQAAADVGKACNG